MSTNRSESNPRVPPISARQVELLLRGLLRHNQLFREAVEILTTGHLESYRPCYAVIWEAARRSWQAHGGLPFREQLEGEVDRLLQDGTYPMDDGETLALRRCLDLIYDPRLDSIEQDRWERATRHYLRELLLDTAVEHLRSEVSGPYRPQDPLQLMEHFRQRVQSAMQASLPPATPAYRPGWRPTGTDRRSTGLPFVDEYMNGGDCPCELYGIVGPYKSAKTALGLALSIEAALRAQRSYDREESATLGISYFASYELPADPVVMLRALCYAAEVPMSEIENERGWERLSTRGQLKPYERERFAHIIAQGLEPPGERERIQSASEALNRNWRLLDMRGREDCYPGVDGAAELCRIIAADQRHLARENIPAHVELVVVDYLLLAVEQQMVAHNAKPEHTRHYMRRFILQTKELADQHHCPIWLLQQLNAEENRRAPGTVTRSTGSAEFRGFAEKLSFAFTLGAKTADNVLVFHCDYQRRASGAQPICLLFDPQFQRFYAQRKLAVDPVTQKVISADELSQLASANMPPAARMRGLVGQLRRVDD